MQIWQFSKKDVKQKSCVGDKYRIISESPVTTQTANIPTSNNLIYKYKKFTNNLRINQK